MHLRDDQKALQSIAKNCNGGVPQLKVTDIFHLNVPAASRLPNCVALNEPEVQDKIDSSPKDEVEHIKSVSCCDDDIHTFKPTEADQCQNGSFSQLKELKNSTLNDTQDCATFENLRIHNDSLKNFEFSEIVNVEEDDNSNEIK
ncbi:uncharacterized protein LOC117178681 [Belonocnema kinseyi]|uniref:uncharacterized protein LOC117178681 n=1 Tax=Belonocnema kinseyi TaxID=2817044 RepID=UPI00143DDAB9|nr:uncharacterized protein LOC117178681 [Belonocnema kinseyi]